VVPLQLGTIPNPLQWEHWRWSPVPALKDLGWTSFSSNYSPRLFWGVSSLAAVLGGLIAFGVPSAAFKLEDLAPYGASSVFLGLGNLTTSEASSTVLGLVGLEVTLVLA
jgi:hypothetical protein